MRIHHRKVTGKTNIQMAHIRNTESSQMVSHISRTGTVIIKGAAKILLSRNTRHLAQVFRHIKTHTGRIFKLIQIYLAFKSPLYLIATATNHGTCAQIAHIVHRLHGNDHIKEVSKVLQFYLNAIKALFLENKYGILRIDRQFKASLRISLTQFFARNIGNGRILNRQVSFGFQNHTHN